MSKIKRYPIGAGSSGSSGGAQKLTPTTVKTAAYTAANGDLVVCNATAGAFTVTLPAATAGAMVGIRKGDTSANAVTIAAAGADTIGIVNPVATRPLPITGNVVLVGVAGGWVEVSAGSAISALDTRYVAPRFANAKDLQGTGGTPALGWIGPAGNDRVNVYLMDATSTEDVGYSDVLPSDWATVNVTLVWANTAAATGDVMWQLTLSRAGDGDSALTTTTTGGGTTTAAAPATSGPLKYTQIGTGVVVSANKLLILRIRRFATDAADTLPNDAGIVGLIITKAS